MQSVAFKIIASPVNTRLDCVGAGARTARCCQSGSQASFCSRNRRRCALSRAMKPVPAGGHRAAVQGTRRGCSDKAAKAGYPYTCHAHLRHALSAHPDQQQPLTLLSQLSTTHEGASPGVMTLPSKAGS